MHCVLYSTIVIFTVPSALQRKMQALHAFKGQEEIAKAEWAESNRLNKIPKPNEDDDE